ncbi:MAG: hypothetical protein ACRC5C_09405, partial [Bacilli bacterium]
TYRDAAYFLKRLEDTDWVNGVLFSTVNAQTPAQNPAGGDANAVITEDKNQMPRFTAQYTVYLKPSAWLAQKEAGN